jgi:hypothetical protein
VTESWRLRLVATADIHSLHALSRQPSVHRYLFDGTAPDHEFIANRVAQAIANSAMPGLGMWVLKSHPVSCAGCVELRRGQL